MPLYFFHVRGGRAPAESDEGWDLADEASARQSATSAARSLIASDALEGYLDLSGRIDVEDDDGNLVLSVPFASAVEQV